jgi:hypothetical protein
MKIGRGGVRSKRVIICNKKVAIILLLHFYKIAQSTKIIAKMKIPGWPYATDYCLHNKKK